MTNSLMAATPLRQPEKLAFQPIAISHFISILKSLLDLFRPSRRSISAVAIIAANLFLLARSATPQTKTLAERLGYRPDSKLLILHADDLAVAHSVDRASFAALENKSVTSASVMVPCPWLTEVAELFKQHPNIDLGLHLTLNSEWKSYRWGPVTPRDRVSGLLDPDGYLWVDQESVRRHARPEEVEREIRAQVERAIHLGIRPTHLDSHMATLIDRKYFAALVKVAHEYRLPFLASKDMDPSLLELLSPEDIVLDSRPRIALKLPKPGQPDDAELQYLTALRRIKPGIQQIIVHLGYDDVELRSIMADHPDFGAAWRQRDFDIMNSPEFKEALVDNRITLITWKELGRLLYR